MENTTACHELREPGVIDETIIYNAIIEQGPKAEEGRLFKEQGVVYEEITYLRLEFLDILKIDHLWMMTGLTRLQLCNNIIEEIENLHFLSNLKELDLSFNNITKIQNLESLIKLEILTLFENKIQAIENLEKLESLTVFSIGNNRIRDDSNIIYLRQFDNLKSFNLSGNPVCERDNFIGFIYAYLPQLVYYEYRMIRPEARLQARLYFEKPLVALERDEAEIKEVKDAEKAAAQQEIINTTAFVEYLGGNLMFLELFKNDKDGRTLLEMNEEIRETYNEYQENFIAVSKDLHQVGITQLENRKQEIAMFNELIGNDKEFVFNQSRTLLEGFLEEKKQLFVRLKAILGTDEEDDARIAQLSLDVQEINESFQDLCLRTWHQLMKEELYLFEAMEEINATYERSLTELVNQFVEGCQAQFTLMRNLQTAWNEYLIDATTKYVTNFTVQLAADDVSIDISPELLFIMSDREVLNNAVSASHEMHQLVVDMREDKLVSGVKEWLANFVENIVKTEIDRNRNKVIEINHFLDTQREELEEMTSTPLGLMMLPKEVQDALQIN